MTAAIKPASAVLLLRSEGTDAAGLEVYLVERALELRFMGGFVAFPGGVDAAGEGFAECARRELFEETGVLLGANAAGIDAPQRREWRERLLAAERNRGPDPWPEIAARVGAFAGFEDVGALLTPPFAPVRFDTRFFVARHPAGEVPEVWPGELVAGRFWKPDEALAAWRQGTLRLAPPVLTLIELLAHAGVERFAETARGLMDAFAGGLLPPVRFSPGILMASLNTPTLPPATTTNAYVVGNERIWVVDPASSEPLEQERLAELVESMIEAGREPQGILLTHHHPDHVGGVDALAREFHLRVRCHRETRLRLPAGLPLGEPLEDGDALPLGSAPDGSEDWTLRCLFTPGHARGHLVFHESRYGAAIAGDMISTVSTIVIDPPEGHLATYLASLRRLLELPLAILYPAHGPPALLGRRVVERYLKHRGEREAKLVDALRAGATAIDALLPLVYADTDPRAWPLAARSLLAGIEKLAEEQRPEAAGVRHLLAPS